jgi:hypothetical protein
VGKPKKTTEKQIGYSEFRPRYESGIYRGKVGNIASIFSGIWVEKQKKTTEN